MVGIRHYTNEQIRFICARRHEHPQNIVDACYREFPRTRDFKVTGIRYVLKEHADRILGSRNANAAPVGIQAAYSPNFHRAQFQSNQFMADQMHRMQNNYVQQQQEDNHQVKSPNKASTAHINKPSNKMPQNMQMNPQTLQQLYLQQAQLARLQSIQQQSGHNQNGYSLQSGPAQDFQVECAQHQVGSFQPAIFENSQAHSDQARLVQVHHTQAMVQTANQIRKPSNGSPQPVRLPTAIYNSTNKVLAISESSSSRTSYASGINSPLNNHMGSPTTTTRVTAIGLPVPDTTTQPPPQSILNMAEQSNIQTLDAGLTITSELLPRPETPPEEHRYLHHPVPKSSPYHPSNQLPSTQYLKLMNEASNKTNVANNISTRPEPQSTPHKSALTLASNGSRSPVNNIVSDQNNEATNTSVDLTTEPGSSCAPTPKLPETQRNRDDNAPAMITYNIIEAIFPQKFYLPRADSGWTYSMKDRTANISTHGSESSLPDFTVTNGVDLTVNLFRPKFMAGLGFESHATVSSSPKTTNNQKPAGDKIFQEIFSNVNMPQTEDVQNKRPAQNRTEQMTRPLKRAKIDISQPSTPKRSPPTVGPRGLLTPPATLTTKAKAASTFPQIDMQAYASNEVANAAPNIAAPAIPQNHAQAFYISNEMTSTATNAAQYAATGGSPALMSLQDLEDPFNVGEFSAFEASPNTTLKPSTSQSPVSASIGQQIETPPFENPPYEEKYGNDYWNGTNKYNTDLEWDFVALLGNYPADDPVLVGMSNMNNDPAYDYGLFQHDSTDRSNQNTEYDVYETDNEYAHRTEANGYLNVDDIFGNP